MKNIKLFNTKKLSVIRSSIFDSRYFFTRGVSLVEVIVGTSLIMLSLTGLIGAYSFYLKAGLQNTDHLKSVFLLQEGVETVTLMRDDSWSNLSSLTSGTWYYLSWNGSKWVSTTTESVIDGTFKRAVKLEDVYRKNSGQDIVNVSAPDPKTLDGNTKKVTVRVTASSTPLLDKQVVTYLTNLFE